MNGGSSPSCRGPRTLEAMRVLVGRPSRRVAAAGVYSRRRDIVRVARPGGNARAAAGADRTRILGGAVRAACDIMVRRGVHTTPAARWPAPAVRAILESRDGIVWVLAPPRLLGLRGSEPVRLVLGPRAEATGVLIDRSGRLCAETPSGWRCQAASRSTAPPRCRPTRWRGGPDGSRSCSPRASPTRAAGAFADACREEVTAALVDRHGRAWVATPRAPCRGAGRAIVAPPDFGRRTPG